MILRRLCRYIMLPVVILCFLSSSLVSYAQSQTTYSLTLKFVTDWGAIEDCKFDLYHVLTPDGKLYGDFADLSVEVGNLNSATNVNRLADTLASYAESGIAEPIATNESDVLGHTDFSGLSAGVYLVIGETVMRRDIVYIPKPTLIRIPDSSGGSVEAYIKYSYIPNYGEKKSCTVVKQWDDQDDPSRPKSVTVRLLKDGMFYDEATLSSENDWTYTWEGLDVSYDWTVIEPAVPDGYNVSVVLNDDVFTVVNKKNEPSDTTTPPADITDDTGTDSTDSTDSTDKTDEPDDTGNTTDPPPDTKPQDTNQAGNAGDENNRPSLPYTGQWWIPVPILFVAGLILFLISLISERLSDEDEKK